MNKKAEANLQGILFGILGIGLFMGMMALFISSSIGYDVTDVDLEDISKYSVMPNISERVNKVKNDVDPVTVDKNWFDFLSGVFNSILEPFKFTYRSITILFDLATNITDDLNLPPIIGNYIISALTIIVFVGIVMIKYYMGKQK